MITLADLRTLLAAAELPLVLDDRGVATLTDGERWLQWAEGVLACEGEGQALERSREQVAEVVSRLREQQDLVGLFG